MAPQDDSARLLHRATRDLDAPTAVLVASHPRRTMLAHHGLEGVGAATHVLVAAEPGQFCADRGLDLDGSHAFRSWLAVGVHTDGIEVGTLVVADRRRRWFDPDEVRHLGLLSSSAGSLIAAALPLLIDAVDVRSDERSAALA